MRVLLIFILTFLFNITYSQQRDYNKYDKAIKLFNKNDIKWAIDQSNKVNSDCKLYLQPEWSKKELVLPKIIDFVSKNQNWRISLQTHKYMNLP